VRPTLVCWLRATAADGLRYDLTRAPERPGQAVPLRGALGPEQAIGLAGLLGRKGWTDVQIIRRRLDGPEPPAAPTADAAGEPLQQRLVRLGRDRLLATEIPPPPAVAVARRGLRLAADGDWSGARDALRDAAEQPEAPATVWRSLGIANGRCGDWRYARRALERAIELGDPESKRLLDEVHQIETLTRATSKRAWDPSAHRQLGLLLMAWERGDEALYHLERAVQLAPQDLPARMALGLELLCRGQWAAAAATYAAALELASDDNQRAAAEEGLALAKAGKMPDSPDNAPADVWQDLLAAG
jgi:Flp pilus assembly protein TadD